MTPSAVLGDTAYGHGEQRKALASLGISVIAPVITTQNPTGLYDISHFSYDCENDLYRCPGNKTTVWKNHNTKIEGWQYFFAKKDCKDCPFRTECTSNQNGRSVFHSDHYEIYELAKAYNASEEGIRNYKLRYHVERKNQELKNDCGLGKVETRSKKAISIKATLAGIVLNLKHTVRRLFNPSPGFIRHNRTA
ncbi:transposase [Paenibacillus marchantiophytorum]|uniref:transposase n=1 Tax=Paenibacillus marchantiophytorum TaxID=1619310 RepID=UPI00166B1E5E|nr:transposase [Paenibacillus marchantiophytorum]